MNHFTVDVLTPSKVIARNIPAESLLVPTQRGEINILPDHTHLVTNLGTGILSVFGGSSDDDKFFTVTSGLCKILDNKITILAHTSEESCDLDIDRAQLALDNASNRLNDSELTVEEREKFSRKKERAQLRIQLSKSCPKK